MDKFKKKLQSLPLDSFECIYQGSKYLATKEHYANGKIIKLYARELKGKDIVSGNYFTTIKGGVLKPCEMSDAKVIDFVLHLDVPNA